MLRKKLRLFLLVITLPAILILVVSHFSLYRNVVAQQTKATHAVCTGGVDCKNCGDCTNCSHCKTAGSSCGVCVKQ